MTKEEYEADIEELQERGYRFAGSRYGDRPYYYKAIEYRKDKDGDNRAICQLLFHLYKTDMYRITYYSIDPQVDVSRNTDERLIFDICHPKRSIDECEHIAKKFIDFVDKNIKEQ